MVFWLRDRRKADTMMKRHNYKFRPDPTWKDGYFIPSTPIPIPKHPDDWNKRDLLGATLAMSRNPVEATTLSSMTLEHYTTLAFGETILALGSPDLIKYLFVDNTPSYFKARAKRWFNHSRGRSVAFCTSRACPGFCPATYKKLRHENENIYAGSAAKTTKGRHGHRHRRSVVTTRLRRSIRHVVFRRN